MPSVAFNDAPDATTTIPSVADALEVMKKANPALFMNGHNGARDKNGDVDGGSLGGVLGPYAEFLMGKFASPAQRQELYDRISVVASERPILFSFAVAQLFFSILPLVLFAAFVASTVVFTLVAAAVFALFWVGVALLVLVPVLFVTSSLAVLTWGWAVACVFAVRWLYAFAAAAGTAPGDGSDTAVALAKKDVKEVLQ